MSVQRFGYRLADVFAERPYEGNGVAVFLDPPHMSADHLQTVTVEVRQFESAFLWSTTEPATFDTRIFVVDRELAFAGHPVLGAAAVLHERMMLATRSSVAQSPPRHLEQEWTLRLGAREVAVTSRQTPLGGFDVSMDQGRPVFGEPVSPGYREKVASALSLDVRDLHDDLPVQWVSTGLKYLIVPVRRESLSRARISISDFGGLLAQAGAELAYVLDPDDREGRNWVNDGSVEDIATGSASGPAAAYLIRYGWADPSVPVHLRQGRFLGRPSTMSIDVTGEPQQIDRVVLHGHVWLNGTGTLDTVPAAS